MRFPISRGARARDSASYVRSLNETRTTNSCHWFGANDLQPNSLCRQRLGVRPREWTHYRHRRTLSANGRADGGSLPDIPVRLSLAGLHAQRLALHIRYRDRRHPNTLDMGRELAGWSRPRSHRRHRKMRVHRDTYLDSPVLMAGQTPPAGHPPNAVRIMRTPFPFCFASPGTFAYEGAA